MGVTRTHNDDDGVTVVISHDSIRLTSSFKGPFGLHCCTVTFSGFWCVFSSYFSFSMGVCVCVCVCVCVFFMRRCYVCFDWVFLFVLEHECLVIVGL